MSDPIVQLPVFNKSVDLSLNGSFTGGTIRVSRFGKLVSIIMLTGGTHASASSVNSAANLIPQWAVPPAMQTNAYNFTGSDVLRVSVDTAGLLNTTYTSARTTTLQVSIAYSV